MRKSALGFYMVLAIGLSGLVHADKLYIYKDKAGNTLFDSSGSMDFKDYNLDSMVKYYEPPAPSEEEIKLSKKPDARIGMTAKQVREQTNWGKPNGIRRTITAHGMSEQWVYDGYQYLYFENGKLVTIQQ